MPHAAVSPYEAGAWENPSWWWSEVKKPPKTVSDKIRYGSNDSSSRTLRSVLSLELSI